MASQFRGWYFKCQSKEHTLALIPAIHQGPQGRECSLQLISPENSQTVSLPSQGAVIRWDRPEGQMNGFSFSPKGLISPLRKPVCGASFPLGRLHLSLRISWVPFAMCPFWNAATGYTAWPTRWKDDWNGTDGYFRFPPAADISKEIKATLSPSAMCGANVFSLRGL